MSMRIAFPTDKQQLQDVVKSLVTAGEAARGISEVEWYKNHHYLQGARDFRNLDFRTGTLDINYINQEGYLMFRYEDIVAKYSNQLGRLLQMDLNPHVRRRTIGLENLRNATLAQIALSAAVPPSTVRSLQYMATVPFLKYGCVGLAAVVDDSEVKIDVVMPWEIVPIPPRPLDSAEETGIIRIRWVPKDWLRELPRYKNSRKIDWDAMETLDVAVGDTTHSNTARLATYGGTAAIDATSDDGDWTRANYGGRKAQKDKRTIPLTPFVELWTWDGPEQYVKSYITMAGWQLLERQDDKDYGMEMPVPLRKAVDIPTGGCYGRSYVSTLVPMNTEIEFSLGRLFQNVQDIDAYGILTIPSTLGISPLVIRGEDGIKRIIYQPDYTMPDARPDVISPFNAGTLPVESIRVGSELANRIANQPQELLAGDSPGRTDSRASLGFLWETSNTPLAASALSLASAFSGIYEAVLSMLPTVWGTGKEIKIAMLDDAMAGVIIDPNSGSVNLQSGLNALPKPSEVQIGVKSIMPKSKEQEKAELIDALTAQRIDILDYVIIAYKKGLELPLGHDVEIQNYRRAVQNNIIMWNDGITPKPIAVDDYDDHEVHLRVLKAFTASPEFFAAADPVRQAFTDLIEAHQAAMATYLEELPMPEDAALMSQQGPAPGQPPM